MNIIPILIGVALLMLWVYFLLVGIKTIRIQGSVMQATVFQFNILPFIVGISLIITGSLWWLVVGVVVWILAVPFSQFLTYLFPLIVGWLLGTFVFSGMYPYSKFWYWGGGIIGLLIMGVFCSVVVGIIVGPTKE